jgi:hypothetical protein
LVQRVGDSRFWLDKAIEKSVRLNTAGRYAAMSEWLVDLKRPNLLWINQREQPLLERNPLRFWQICAGLGWVLATVLAIVMVTTE